MSKYEKMNYSSSDSEVTNVSEINENKEQILWSGKPKQIAFIINKSIAMMPIALLWIVFDSIFIFNFIRMGNTSLLWFIVPFFALHLTPVWIWISNILTAKKNWDNTTYTVTDKRIIIHSGFINKNYGTIFYKDISNVQLNISLVDKYLHVGDIIFTTTASVPHSFLDLEDPFEVYEMVQKIVLDIQTDIEYPNNLRPKENSGYQTEYKPK